MSDTNLWWAPQIAKHGPRAPPMGPVYGRCTASLGMCAHGLDGTRDYQNMRPVARPNSPEHPKGAPRRSKYRSLTRSWDPNHACAAPSPNCMRLRQRQIVVPARLLCTGPTSMSAAVGRTQRSACRRRDWSRSQLLRTHEQSTHSARRSAQVGYHGKGRWANLRCAPLAERTGTRSG
jgi:hypothetical protein